MPLASFVLGIIGLVKARKEPERYSGSGLAIGGIVLSVLTVPIVMAIALPNLLKSRQAANEASAIATIRRIGTAEATYQSTTGRGRDFGSFEELIKSGLLEDVTVKNGYEFKVVADGNRFQVTATPQSYGAFGTGHRSFYADERYVITATDSPRPATRDDRALE